MDVVEEAIRTRMMSGIRGKDTRPELVIRQGLHRMGFRYRLHDKSLPGKPDLVFPRFKALIQIHGCFWHMHECHLFKWPRTRAEFWREKIEANVERDHRCASACAELGWRSLIIWECAIKGKYRRDLHEVLRTAANWIRFDDLSSDIAGHDRR